VSVLNLEMLSSLLSTRFSGMEREKILLKIESYLKIDEMIKAFPYYEVIDHLFTKKNITKYDLLYHTTKSGNIRLFKELVNKGFSWDSRMMNCACYYGYIEMLDYLHQRGAPFDFSNVLCAVKGRQIYCLSYLFSKGTSFPDIAVETAIENDCYDVLLFLLDYHQIQPIEKWMKKAIYYQKVDIFKELYNKNPIKSTELFVYALKKKQRIMKDYILESHQFTDIDFLNQCMRMEEKYYEEEIEKMETENRKKSSMTSLKKLEESFYEDEFNELFSEKSRLSKKSIQKSKKIMKEEMEREFVEVYKEKYELTPQSIKKSKKILDSEMEKEFEEVHQSRRSIEPFVDQTFPRERCRQILKDLEKAK